MTNNSLEPGKAPLEWHIPEDIKRRYANNVLVQAGEYEIVVSFFETVAPVFTGTPEEIEAKAKEVKSVRSNCVASIILAVDRVPSVVKVLQEVYDRFQARKQEDAAKEK